MQNRLNLFRRKTRLRQPRDRLCQIRNQPQIPRFRLTPHQVTIPALIAMPLRILRHRPFCILRRIN